jgi:hypothetical protein
MREDYRFLEYIIIEFDLHFIRELEDSPQGPYRICSGYNELYEYCSENGTCFYCLTFSFTNFYLLLSMGALQFGRDF